MASIIDRETAKKLIAEYKTQNAAAGGPALKAPDGKYLDGFFLDKDTLQSILNGSDCNGIHVMLAKDPNFAGAKEHIINILLMGSNGGVITSDASTDTANPNVYGPTPTCPVFCPPPL